MRDARLARAVLEDHFRLRQVPPHALRCAEQDQGGSNHTVRGDESGSVQELRVSSGQ